MAIRRVIGHSPRQPDPGQDAFGSTIVAASRVEGQHLLQPAQLAGVDRHCFPTLLGERDKLGEGAPARRWPGLVGDFHCWYSGLSRAPDPVTPAA